MAGTIFGLPLSQRVDANGKPLQGWLLYIYQQNSSTPVDSFSDSGLTIKNTWPLEADSSGMCPQFWLADGAYRVRGTTDTGSLTLFDLTSVTALGPSTGAVAVGGVDTTSVFQTGDVMWLDVSATRAGWVRDNGRTIGSATSGASERANADCQALFTFLWTNFADSICAVAGGRGGSALADWGANKKIALPDKRGYGMCGLDDMGNTSSARLSGAGPPKILGSNYTTAGAICGEFDHTLQDFEMASHNHTISITDPGHSHTVTRLVSASTGSAGGGNLLGSSSSANTGAATTGITASSANAGSDVSHNIMQPTVLGTFYRKL